MKEQTILRILLVEDNPHDAVAFRRAFQNETVPAAVTHYIKAEEALPRAISDADAFDLIVTDYKLPGMSGLEFCNELISVQIGLPIVLLTGGGTEALAVEAMRAGVDDYLIKDGDGGYLKLLPVVLHSVVEKFRDRIARQEIEARLEDQIRLNQKIEAISTLAGGIAHNFNNILSIISGNIELIHVDLKVDHLLDRYLTPIDSSVSRMSRLTDQLLAFAGKGKYRPQQIHLSEVVSGFLPTIIRRLSEIRLHTDLAMQLPSVKADASQIQMALSAIIQNAAEAIDGSGDIHIRTSEKEIDEARARALPDARPGLYVCLTVEDNGSGMSAETRARIFDPFFTTKLQGRGLGMAAVFGIVKNHDGWIDLDSKPGSGTTIHLFIPAISDERCADRESRTDMIRGSGTLLLVEDEPMVMEVTQAMLERLGYSVFKAGTGQQGIDLLSEQKEKIDLVILDIGLPDIRGDEVHARMMEIVPDLKVLVSSGYAREEVFQEMEIPTAAFIQKPYSFSVLSAKLEKILTLNHDAEKIREV